MTQIFTSAMNAHVGQPKSINAVGGIVVGADNVSNKFVERFGTSWRLIPGSKDTYVIFDLIDDCDCFIMNDLMIVHYPGVTKSQFIANWEGMTAGHPDQFSGWHYPVDPSFKYSGLQIMKIFNSLEPERSMLLKAYPHLNKKV